MEERGGDELAPPSWQTGTALELKGLQTAASEKTSLSKPLGWEDEIGWEGVVGLSSGRGRKASSHLSPLKYRGSLA